ncbi:hypothetical protein PND17_09440 [Streptococcus thermophilus]|nr:hypothetical protein [Streptococcus thermophilus]WCL61162.1 hypothetical protein PND17_09440 [Streptococcus thermophilus]
MLIVDIDVDVGGVDRGLNVICLMARRDPAFGNLAMLLRGPEGGGTYARRHAVWPPMFDMTRLAAMRFAIWIKGAALLSAAFPETEGRDLEARLGQAALTLVDKELPTDFEQFVETLTRLSSNNGLTLGRLSRQELAVMLLYISAALKPGESHSEREATAQLDQWKIQYAPMLRSDVVELRRRLYLCRAHLVVSTDNSKSSELNVLFQEVNLVEILLKPFL